ncbi:MAG TPA: autotransporter domain-containing protein [Rhabdochlamydiaceae bacterium]|nr:autotransporter domain-containing protein [Rhabdochlamydiaceae bacterium]
MKVSHLAAGLVCLFLGLIHEISAKQPTIVCFGDSGADSGNSPNFTRLTPTSTFAYPAAPHSNGATWIVQLGNLWKTHVEPSTRGGLNYAFASAASSQDGEKDLAKLFDPQLIATGKIFIPSLKTQINEFLTQRKDVSKNAVIFYHAASDDLTDLSVLAAGDAVSSLQLLKSNGYKNQVTFLKFNNDPALELFASEFNNALLNDLNETSLHPVVIDTSAFTIDLQTNLAFYGFVGLGPMETSTGPNNTYFWFDNLHQSELSQHLFSEYVYNILAAPVYVGRLAAQPLAVMRGQNAVLRQELYPITTLCVGQVYPFFSGSYIPAEKAPFAKDSGDGSGWNATAGVAYRYLCEWTLGIAGGYNRNFFEDHNTLGKCTFDLNSWIVSFFSDMQIGHGYFNGIISVGWMKFDDIERKFSIGPKTWHAKGDTSGMQYDALFEGGWFCLRKGMFQMGPIATLEYQHDDIHGYTEHNASYNDLQYKEQHINSLIAGVGLEALISNACKCSNDCVPGFSMTLFLAANEEFFNSKRTIKFRQQIIGPDAPYGNWPISQDWTFFGSYGLNMTYSWQNKALFSWGYRGNIGQHGMFEQNLTANVTFPL